MRTLIVSLAAAAMVAGCSTVTMSSPGTLSGVDVKGAGGRADRVISISNEGYFLFHCIPLVTGSTEWSPSEKKLRNDVEFFSNQMTGEKMLAAMTRYAESMNCDLVDIVVIDKNSYPIGLFDLQGWANTILADRSITYSGVLCPRGGAVKGGTRK